MNIKSIPLTNKRKQKIKDQVYDILNHNHCYKVMRDFLHESQNDFEFIKECCIASANYKHEQRMRLFNKKYFGDINSIPENKRVIKYKIEISDIFLELSKTYLQLHN